MKPEEYKNFRKEGQIFQATQSEENIRNKKIIEETVKDRKIQANMLKATRIGLILTVILLFLSLNKDVGFGKFLYKKEVVVSKNIYECDRQKLEFDQVKRYLVDEVEYHKKLNECNSTKNKSIYFNNVIDPECILEIRSPVLQTSPNPVWEKTVEMKKTIYWLFGIKVSEKDEGNDLYQNTLGCLLKKDDSTGFQKTDFDVNDNKCINFTPYDGLKNSNEVQISWQISIDEKNPTRIGLRNKYGSLADKFAYQVYVVDPKGNIYQRRNVLESDVWSYDEFPDNFTSAKFKTGGIYKVFFSVSDYLVACNGFVLK